MVLPQIHLFPLLHFLCYCRVSHNEHVLVFVCVSFLAFRPFCRSAGALWKVRKLGTSFPHRQGNNKSLLYICVGNKLLALRRIRNDWGFCVCVCVFLAL
jgi:hypothetical protein